MKNTEASIRDARSIFACDWCLIEIITKLYKYLKAKLPSDNEGYFCFWKEGMYDDESDWYFTDKFRGRMRIDTDFISVLNEALDYQNHEDDIVNKFTVEQAIQKIRQYSGLGQGIPAQPVRRGFRERSTRESRLDPPVRGMHCTRSYAVHPNAPCVPPGTVNGVPDNCLA